MKYKHYNKASLLIQSIESSLLALKMELFELDDNNGDIEGKEKSDNIFKLEDLISTPIDDYEPDYYEEND
jgi:hypothetical protein